MYRNGWPEHNQKASKSPSTFSNNVCFELKPTLLIDRVWAKS